jgi:hypothetical protein
VILEKINVHFKIKKIEMQQFQLTSSLLNALAIQTQEITYLYNYIHSLKKDIEKYHCKEALQILGSLIPRQFTYHQTRKRYLLVSLRWSGTMENFLKELPFGTLLQPLPHFRSKSNLIIRKFSTLEEIEKLFPNRLQKEYIGVKSLLIPPLTLIWSKTSKTLRARFKYEAQKFDGN